MTKIEMVRQALLHLGEAPPVEISAFIERWHGVRIEPRFIPIVRASLRDLEVLAKSRQESRKRLETDQAGRAA